ncbi:MAG: CHC2 zinc finger domain-containing protein [Candidatus Onthovivens sp.]|nr:CHC2 zinc finger domain-containing protein [Candidatus Onthovivens sp.]
MGATMEIQDINLKELIKKEIGLEFGKNNKISCPFHSEKTPSLSVHFNSNTNRETYKCFGCGATGDAIQFIRDYKKMSFIEARKYLGLEEEKPEQKEIKNLLEKYCKWLMTKDSNLKELLGIFTYVNEENKPIYYKAKFKTPNKNTYRFLHIYEDNGKKSVKQGMSFNGSNIQILPYNYYNLLQGIGQNKVIVITEGEKDANTLNHVLPNKNYVATSVKDVKDFSFLNGAKVYIVGDTGEAGLKYIDTIKKNIVNIVEELRVVTLPRLEDLGDNKDITDWIEAGHTKEKLYRAFNKSLNLKSRYDLQQNSVGIYKQVPSKVNEGDYDKIYITNFQILKAVSTVNIDENIEGVELTIRADNGNILIVKALATDFDDIKSFRNRLGSMDLAFKGKINDLITLKEWVAKYFINSRYKLINGNKFLYKDNKLNFITSDGAVSGAGIDKTIKSNEDNLKINLPEDNLTKEEFKELMKHLFEFTTYGRAYSIIGTLVNNLAVAQTEKLKIKLHHLLIVGEAGSGKSTILEKVVAPLLNYSTEQIKSIGEATKFSLIKTLSNGNYTVLYDEFKPSMMNKYKKDELSNILRNLYDRTSISRGQKNMTVKDYRLSRPLIMAGEESFAYGETAQLERSCIVYLSKNERTTENTKTMEYLIEHGEALNKLGKELIKEVLSLSIEDYKAIRNNIEVTEIDNRIKNTCVNICAGMEIFNKILDRYGLQKVENFIEPILENIKAEILEDKEEVSSVVENLLKKFDELLEDNKVTNPDRIIQDKRDETEIYIKTNLMLDEIRLYVKNTNNNDIMVISDKDFKKQAKKAGYILGAGRDGRVIKVREDEPSKYKTVRFDIYSKGKLRTLEVNSIVEPELTPVSEEEAKVIQGVFDNKK